MGWLDVSGHFAEHESAFAYKRVIGAAWLACAVVLGLGYATEIYATLIGRFSIDLHFELFRLDGETNIPSAFSAMMLFSVAVQMFTAGGRERHLRRPTAWGWTLLGVIFIYLGIDEIFGLHEAFIYASFLPRFDAFFHFRWVILGIALVVIVATVFFPFLLRLPRITAIRLFLAGAVYVTGALGFEMIGGYISEHFGERSVLYVLETTIEESLEDIGIVLALRCLILHLAVVLPPSPQPVTVLRSRLLVWIALLGLLVLLAGGYVETNLRQHAADFFKITTENGLIAMAIAAVLILDVWFAVALSRNRRASMSSTRYGWIGLAVTTTVVAVALIAPVPSLMDPMLAALLPDQPGSARWLILGLALAVVAIVLAGLLLGGLGRKSTQRLVAALLVLCVGLVLGQAGVARIVELNGGKTILHLIVVAMARALQMLGAILLLRAILFERQTSLFQPAATAAANASKSG